MSLHWIVQGTPYKEVGHAKLVELLRRLDVPHTDVKVVPFSHEIIPEPDCGKDVIVMGSTTLADVALARDWTPGVFTNEHFDYRSYMDHYGMHMLNHDAIICEFGNVKSPWPQFFFRPTADSKSFPGMVVEADNIDEWADKVRAIEQENYTTIDSKTPVVVAPLKKILREYRFFIVDGKVVTGAWYKQGDHLIKETNTTDADDFAQRMVDVWSPAEAFVLDIALTSTGFRVLEVNCFNCSGYYASDVEKLFHAVEKKWG